MMLFNKFVACVLSIKSFIPFNKQKLYVKYEINQNIPYLLDNI